MYINGRVFVNLENHTQIEEVEDDECDNFVETAYLRKNRFIHLILLNTQYGFNDRSQLTLFFAG